MEEMESWEDVYNVVSRGEGKHMDNFSWLDDPQPSDWTIDGDQIKDAIENNLDEKSETLLRKYLHIKKDVDLTDVADKNDEVRDTISRAIYDGGEVGSQNEAYDDITHQLGKVTDNGFFIDFKTHPYKLKISVKTLKKMLDGDMREDIERSGLDSLMDFKYSEPHYGYSGFDDNTFNERFRDGLYELDRSLMPHKR